MRSKVSILFFVAFSDCNFIINNMMRKWTIYSDKFLECNLSGKYKKKHIENEEKSTINRYAGLLKA